MIKTYLKYQFYIDKCRQLYDFCLKISCHPRAKLYLFIFTFFESIIFPIPQDVMLLPMMLAQPKKSFIFATICLIASLAGALTAYAIGLWFFDMIALPIIEFYQYQAKTQEFQELFNKYDWQVVIIGAISPIPFKIVTLMSGFFNINIFTFIFSTILGRSVRFYVLALFVYFFGDACKIFIDRYFNILSIMMVACIIGLTFALPFLS